MQRGNDSSAGKSCCVPRVIPKNKLHINGALT